ncbi:MAG: cyclic nucleotide-binding domain-containing protein [Microcoleaceae cyanobacterium]
MNTSDLIIWLQERTAFDPLRLEVLASIAEVLESRQLDANQIIVAAGETPQGLYILQSGQVETQAYQSYSYSLLPGSVINLQELLLNQPIKQSLITLTPCQLWFITAETFRELCHRYPEVNQIFSQQLAQAVESLSSRLAYEQERLAILQPYLVPKVRRGVVGKSRYAVRLRSQVIQAARDRSTVLLFGEPGLEKDNLAALIHFSSPSRRKLIIQIDCSKLQANGATLFGRAGGKPGFIEALEDGTLVLNNVDRTPKALLPKIADLVKTKIYTPIGSSETPAQEKPCQARIILISETIVPELKNIVETEIKAVPLRVRKADIDDLSRYFISLICRDQKVQKVTITPEAIRRLQTYDFPSNLRELYSLLERAVVQLQGSSEITEEIIWPAQTKKKQFRWNLLNAYPDFRRFLRSPWWPDRINYGIVLPTYTLVVLILFLAPQTRDRNFALVLFWAWWWPLILLAFPFVGRLWCSVCPFMIYGELVQTISLKLFPRQLKRWPRKLAEKWGGWFLFGLFALILLWEELWELPNTAYLSADLLLLITAGAVICSLIFERRFWCRYLCPIGGMNGLFAKLSMTELRAQQGICSAECTTYQCYKGGPQKGEGLATDGCPLYSHPAQLDDNRDCVLCMTCLKACPHRSVAINLRPPGIDLWTSHLPRSYEVALLFLLLNVVFLHHLPEIQILLNLPEFHSFGTHALGAIILLSAPVALPLLAHGVMRLIAQVGGQFKPRRFVELAYGYLPLVLAANLSHYLQLGLFEGGQVLPVAAMTFGLAGAELPMFIAHPAVISFLQGTTLVAGVFATVILTQKVARQSFRWLLPQHLCSLVLTVLLWQVIVGQ